MPWFVHLGWSIIAVLYTYGLYRAFINGKKQPRLTFNPYNPQMDITVHKKNH
jgi:hypothetical protein